MTLHRLRGAGRGAPSRAGGTLGPGWHYVALLLHTAHPGGVCGGRRWVVKWGGATPSGEGLEQMGGPFLGNGAGSVLGGGISAVRGRGADREAGSLIL